MAEKYPRTNHANGNHRTDYITENITDVREDSEMIRKSAGALQSARIGDGRKLSKDIVDDKCNPDQCGIVVPSKLLFYPTPNTRKIRYPQLQGQEQFASKSDQRKDTPRPDKVVFKPVDRKICTELKEAKKSDPKAKGVIGIDPSIKFNEISKDVIASSIEPGEITAGELPGIMKDSKISEVIFDPKQPDEKFGCLSLDTNETSERRVSFEDKVEIIDSEDSPEEREAQKPKRYIPVSERMATPISSLNKLSIFSGIEESRLESGTGDFVDDMGYSTVATNSPSDKLDLNESMDECSFVLNSISDYYPFNYAENKDTVVLTKKIPVVSDRERNELDGGTPLKKYTDNVVNKTLDYAILKASMINTSHIHLQARNDGVVVRLDGGQEGSEVNLMILNQDNIEDKRSLVEERISKFQGVISIFLDQPYPGEKIFNVKSGESLAFCFKSSHYSTADGHVRSQKLGPPNNVSRFTGKSDSIDVNTNRDRNVQSVLVSSSSSSLCQPISKSSNLNVHARPFYPSSAHSSTGNFTKSTEDSSPLASHSDYLVNRFSNSRAKDQNNVTRLSMSSNFVVERAAQLLGSMSEKDLELDRILRLSKDFELP